ncbi:uncharacterized protein LOC143295219 [Babylonia areolata]|uniref:uncharacterized protein LOC143295219 n=1 Tax=Babylonia areolata TaxID=304850 RepID=UPI003FD68B23
MKELARTLHPNAAKTNMADINKLIQFRKHTADAQKGFSPTETRFKKDAAYVVVGGLTGLGWICVEFLARHNAGCIAIINRSTPSADKTAATDKLSRQYKCQIKTYQADITSFESLRQIFTKIDSSSFQLRGVFMGAAVLKDSSFLAMRKEDFERVLMPKVKGAWNLHQLTKKRPLDHFVLHSSIVSVLGNPGQANYVTGNAFLDGLAWYRHHLGLAAQTINWGPLDTGILDQQDVLQEKMKSAGFHIPGHQEISSTLATVLCTKQTQTVPARIDPTLYAKKLYSATQAQPVVLRFGKFAPPTSVRNQTFIQSSVDMSRVKSLSPQERFQAYESYVTERVSHLVQVTHLSRDVSLTAMGMDSLSANRLLDEIQQDTGFKIPIVEIITEEATVRSLARVLDQYASDSGLAEKTQF